VFAPTLTGVCERSHLDSPSVDLSTQIRDVVNEIRWKDLENVVLVGHSYGGMVITGVAEQVASKIASIVYLDAFVPRMDSPSPTSAERSMRALSLHQSRLRALQSMRLIEPG
jgi:pimeloyl-ACP methyl ester carboxylesterase